MPSSRRLLPQPPQLAGLSYEKIAAVLDVWLERLVDQLNDGIPAGFNNVDPEDVGALSDPGDEDQGWAAANHSHRMDILTTKGDLLGHTGTDPSRLAVGTNGLVPIADSAQPLGIRWGVVAGGYGTLAPAQITSNQNNYAPGLATVYYLTSDADRSITGFSSSGVVDGEFRYFINVGSFDITLEHEDVLSTAANRFVGPGAFKLVMDPGDMAMLLYDSPRTRWRAYELVGGLFAAAGGGGAFNNAWYGPPDSMYFG